MSEIKVTRNVSASGKSLTMGMTYQVPEDVSEQDAGTLIRMKKAVRVVPVIKPDKDKGSDDADKAQKTADKLKEKADKAQAQVENAKTDAKKAKAQEKADQLRSDAVKAQSDADKLKE